MRLELVSTLSNDSTCKDVRVDQRSESSGHALEQIQSVSESVSPASARALQQAWKENTQLQARKALVASWHRPEAQTTMNKPMLRGELAQRTARLCTPRLALLTRMSGH